MRKIKCFGLVFFILGILIIMSQTRREYYPSPITNIKTQKKEKQEISLFNISRS